MGIKDKLIQILGWYEADKAVADEVLAQIRCENCKHWARYYEPLKYYKPKDLGSCAVGICQTTEPDFFCALFEAK